MKTLTEMKKVHCIHYFSFLIIALGCVIGFSSCGSDDETIPTFTLNDVNGNYTGKMQTLAVQPQNKSTGTSEAGITINAEVKDNNVFLNKFPVEDLIKSILGDNDMAVGIIEAIGDVNYQVAFQPSFNDKQDIIFLKLNPKPLEIKIVTPSNTEEGESSELNVKVIVTAEEQGIFSYTDHKLSFALHATEVYLNESETSFPGFKPTTFKFILNKK